MWRALRARLACLVALGLAFLPTAIGAQQACQTLAERVRTAEPPARGDNPWSSPVKMLAGQPNAWLHLDEGKSLTPKAATELLKGDLHASPRLVDAVAELVGVGEILRLHRFGSSELRAAAVNQGSAGCQYFVFLTTQPDGRTDLVEPPSVLRIKDGEVPPCSGFGGLALTGDVGGAPVLIVEQGRDLHEEITVTPWKDGWQKSCTLVMDFAAAVAVAEQYCAQDLDCAKIAERVKALVLRYDKNPNAFADEPGLDERLRALRKRAEDRPVGSRDFPAFGTRPKYDAAEFSETTVIAPVMLDGQAYIAKIGHGSIGWRTYPDYLVGLYRLAGDDFEPVAGVIFSKKRSKPVAMTVK